MPFLIIFSFPQVYASMYPHQAKAHTHHDFPEFMEIVDFGQKKGGKYSVEQSPQNLILATKRQQSVTSYRT